MKKILPLLLLLLIPQCMTEQERRVNDFDNCCKAARAGDADTVMKYLRDKGVTISQRDNNNNTLLHYSAYFERWALVRQLLDLGADVEMKDRSGSTLLGIMANKGYRKETHDEFMALARYIVMKGAAVNATNQFGYTPVFNASDTGCADLLQILIENGGNVYVTTSIDCYPDWNSLKRLEGVTPLMIAAKKGNIECISLLVQGKAKINQQAANGWTPVMFAIHSANLQTVQALIAHGADMTAIKNNSGQTGLDFALQAKNSQIRTYFSLPRSGNRK